jgi:hypothetical protein
MYTLHDIDFDDQLQWESASKDPSFDHIPFSRDSVSLILHELHACSLATAPSTIPMP